MSLQRPSFPLLGGRHSRLLHTIKLDCNKRKYSWKDFILDRFDGSKWLLIKTNTCKHHWATLQIKVTWKNKLCLQVTTSTVSHVSIKLDYCKVWEPKSTLCFYQLSHTRTHRAALFNSSYWRTCTHDERDINQSSLPVYTFQLGKIHTHATFLQNKLMRL